MMTLERTLRCGTLTCRLTLTRDADHWLARAEETHDDPEDNVTTEEWCDDYHEAMDWLCAASRRFRATNSC